MIMDIKLGRSLGLPVAILLAVVLVASSSPPRYKRETHPSAEDPAANLTSTVATMVDQDATKTPVDTPITGSSTTVSPVPETQAPMNQPVLKPEKPKPLFSSPKADQEPPIVGPAPSPSSGKEATPPGPLPDQVAPKEQRKEEPKKQGVAPEGMPVLNSFAALAEDETVGNASEEAPTLRKHQDLMDLLSFAASFGFDDNAKPEEAGVQGGSPKEPEVAPEGRSMSGEEDHSLVSKVKEDQQVCHPKDKECNLKKAVDRSIEIDASMDESLTSAMSSRPKGRFTITTTTTTTTTTTPKPMEGKDSKTEEGFFGIFKRMWWF